LQERPVGFKEEKENLIVPVFAAKINEEENLCRNGQGREKEAGRLSGLEVRKGLTDSSQ